MLTHITFSYKDAKLDGANKRNNIANSPNAKLAHINHLVDAINTSIFTPATVTQATSVTTGVTVNGRTGVITTVSTAVATDATVSFAVTNSSVTAASVVIATVDMGASAGQFVATVDTVAAGSFNVNLTNVGALSDDAVKIHFLVL